MVFAVDEKPCFEIPLTNVNSCTAMKNEAVLEFLQNDDCTVSLMEMRFHIPQDPEADEDADPVEVSRFSSSYSCNLSKCHLISPQFTNLLYNSSVLLHLS
jgi:hypothetical protein